jgi:hypothetical protein
MNVWIVGQLRPDLHHRWEICGIYREKPDAVAACRDDSYFIGNVPLDTPFPEESTVLPEFEFPKAGEA